MKIPCLALLTVLILLAGCRTTTLGPEPTTPEYTISVTIDSIPSGADVYAIESDGHLGRKLGTTPFVYEVGVAPQFRFWEDTGEAAFISDFWRWGEGTHWGRVDGRSALFLDIALAKGDHSLAVASKEIFLAPRGSRERMQDEEVALTVPLKTLEQVRWEWEAYIQKKSLTEKKHIVIEQRGDQPESLQSGLDTLIKLQQAGGH